MKRQNKLNGPGRVIDVGGNIWFQTFKDNKLHGLSLGVQEDRIVARIWREGNRLLRLKFDFRGNVLEREDYNDKKKEFLDVSPEMFLK